MPTTISKKTKKKVARRPAKAAPAAATAPRVNVRALRQAIGKNNGVASVSRAVLAKLVGVSNGSIFNWEHGKPAEGKHVARLKELEGLAASGKVKVTIPRRGGRRKKAGRAKAPSAPSRSQGRRGRPVKIRGDAPVFYANQVFVANGGGDVRIRLGLSVPGEGGARAVADVVIPSDVFERLRR